MAFPAPRRPKPVHNSAVANLVLGVSGSIAAYRAADLARELMRAGFHVRVCLTDAAERFVSKALFEGLTGQPCLSDVFEEPEPGRMAHIEWARQADVLLIAPATANTINRIAFGLADDMITTIAMAFERQMLVAPAMNPSMYANPITQEALGRLSGMGAAIIEPAEGDVACGEHGEGKLASIPSIIAAVMDVSNVARSFAGKKVLITSGPTREPIDDVRFLSNRSSGKMGAALARAATMLGADVTVITGPTEAPLPRTAQVIRVQTASEMLDAATGPAREADFIVGAAAVADFRPSERVSGKIRRSDAGLKIELVPNADILAELASVSSPATKIIAFAAEPNSDLEAAKAKLKQKKAYAIAHNDISRVDIGFEQNQNALTLITVDGKVVESGRRSKLACALWLFEQLAE